MDRPTRKDREREIKKERERTGLREEEWKGGVHSFLLLEHS